MAGRVRSWHWLVPALGFVLVGNAAVGQSSGSVVFLAHRPPARMSSIPGWAHSNAVHAFEEDTTNHVWHVQFFAFFSHAPNTQTLNMSWYHVSHGVHTLVPGQSTDITLTDPTQTALYQTATLHRGPDEFQPMEDYEVVITKSDSSGAREIAHGRVSLHGEVERHSGEVNFNENGTASVH